MRLTSLAIAIVCAAGACGPNGSRAGGDGGPGDGRAPPDAAVPYLAVSPATATLTVTDGAPQMQAYTVALVAVDGTMTDVTAQTTLALSNAAFGTIAGTTVTATGGGAGVVKVQAMAGNAVGTAQLTVIVKGSRVDTGAPSGAAGLFGGATEAGAPAAIVYPADGVLAPPNVGAFDVHWSGAAAGANLFAIEFANMYIDYTVYTTATAGTTAGTHWSALLPAEWTEVAGTQQPIAITVASLNTTAPTTKATSPAIHVSASNEALVGGMYYWSTNTAGGTVPGNVFRYDMSKPDVAPASYYTQAQVPGGYCIGCHVLSHDGTKLAFDVGTPGGAATVINVADGTVQIPYATNPQTFSFATFNGDGSKLVTVENDGTLALRSAAGGAVIAPIPNSPATTADHPEVSPDGTMLVNVEESSPQDFLTPITGGLVVRAFDDTTNAFGPIKTVLADDATGATQLSSFYPSWSPDGQWLVTTRVIGSTNEGAYNNIQSTIWVVKADGSAPPIALAAANMTGHLGNSWARWAPFAETVGSDGQPVYFITFTSQRGYGVRAPAVGTEQIWMTSFSPSKAAAGMDPSTPALRLPFQDLGTGNHIAQWTQQIVQVIQ